jgi:S-adenosylmethionine synthetase
VRRVGTLPYLRPDGKTQVSVTYEDGRPVALETVLISTQHDPGIDLETLLLPDLTSNVITPLLPPELDSSSLRILANPTGVFELGGPHADTGLTGRKIIVDTYGGMARHGGGAFSGKDPSKVDRSAAYAARWVAKNVVAAGLADRFEIELAYTIGVARPVSVSIETYGTEKVSDQKILAAIAKHFDLRPARIIEALDLRRPIYQPTAAYGHFGRSDHDFPWERTNKAAALADECGVVLAEAAGR